MEGEILLILLSQVITAVASVGAIKTDISWIKKTIEELQQRVSRIEQESHCIKAKKSC